LSSPFFFIKFAVELHEHVSKQEKQEKIDKEKADQLIENKKSEADANKP